MVRVDQPCLCVQHMVNLFEMLLDSTVLPEKVLSEFCGNF